MEGRPASPIIYHVAVNLFVTEKEAADEFIQNLKPPGKEEGLLAYLVIREKLEGEEAKQTLYDLLVTRQVLKEKGALGA